MHLAQCICVHESLVLLELIGRQEFGRNLTDDLLGFDRKQRFEMYEESLHERSGEREDKKMSESVGHVRV